jgi:FAD:protein FMN transferase
MIVRSGPSVIVRFRAMNCPCEAIFDTPDNALGRELAGIVEDEARRVEAKFSRYLRGNIVDRINSAGGGPVAVDDETAQLLNYAAQCHSLSGGLFDITSGVLRRAWTFDGGVRVSPFADVAGLLPLVGWERVAWNGRSIRLRPGMEIDLGGIGKEYAVDRALTLARRRADVAALVNFGGDIAVGGRRENGAPWSIGIERVDRTDEAAAVLYLKSGAVATSGDARKFLVVDGKRHGHILDPRTGFPVEGAPRSVTVVAATCSEAGFLSTLGMLKGAEAESFLSGTGARFTCLRDPAPAPTVNSHS